MIVLLLAAVAATPGALLQLADIPAIAWLLGSLALLLFWRGDTHS
jgi:hypothetical protein